MYVFIYCLNIESSELSDVSTATQISNIEDKIIELLLPETRKKKDECTFGHNQNDPYQPLNLYIFTLLLLPLLFSGGYSLFPVGSVQIMCFKVES